MKNAFSILIMAMCYGCTSVNKDKALYEICVGNHSTQELRSIVIDPDGLRGDFGYFGKGSPTSEAAAGFCPVRFDSGFAIEWNENGVIKKQLIDISKYKGQKNVIKSFGFYYLGNNQWRVVAWSGLDRDSKIVQPID